MAPLSFEKKPDLVLFLSVPGVPEVAPLGVEGVEGAVLKSFVLALTGVPSVETTFFFGVAGGGKVPAPIGLDIVAG